MVSSSAFPSPDPAEPPAAFDRPVLWLDPLAALQVTDPRSLFAQLGPCELEIGSGKGLFLCRESGRRPEVQFVGVEWAAKYARLAADRLARLGRTNARMLIVDVTRLLPLWPDQCLAGAHIYFPDPWWKRRHRKRRMFQRSNLAQIARLLQPGAILAFATDVEEYHQVQLRVMEESPEFQRLAGPAVGKPEHDLDYLTHFERKYRIEGRSIYHARYQRLPTSDPCTP